MHQLLLKPSASVLSHPDSIFPVQVWKFHTSQAAPHRSFSQTWFHLSGLLRQAVWSAPSYKVLCLFPPASLLSLQTFREHHLKIRDEHTEHLLLYTPLQKDNCSLPELTHLLLSATKSRVAYLRSHAFQVTYNLDPSDPGSPRIRRQKILDVPPFLQWWPDKQESLHLDGWTPGHIPDPDLLYPSNAHLNWHINALLQKIRILRSSPGWSGTLLLSRVSCGLLLKYPEEAAFPVELHPADSLYRQAQIHYNLPRKNPWQPDVLLSVKPAGIHLPEQRS